MDHIDFHKILVHFQHGFRALHSCETQLLNTVEELIKGLNDKEELDLIVLDFSKAFDTVAHQRLLGKLQYYGVRGATHKWVTNWLTGRVQRVVIDSSEEVPVLSGVPQGTVLGPLMFILYINDISEGVTSTVKLFADDCLLFRRIRTLSDRIALQSDLDRLCNWAESWQMSFNPGKCSVLTISLKRNTVQNSYTMHGQTLQHCDHHPYLGVEMSSDMSWNHHIKATTAKAQRSLNLLRRNLSGCSRETKSRAYTTMVRPILEYAGSVWDPYHQNQIDALEAIQRRAARFACNLYSYEESVTAMLNTLGWRSLQERRFISRQCMLYKTIQMQTACTFPSYVTPQSRTTRASHDLQYCAPTGKLLDVYKYSFFPRTVRAWNILPADIVEASSPDIFKQALQQAFLDGHLHMMVPKDKTQRPRLGSTRAVSTVGPVY